MRALTRLIAVSLVALWACDNQTTTPPGGEGLTLTIVGGPPQAAANLDSGHVIVDGPTRKTVTVTPGTTVTVDGLAPGSYTVALEGFHGGGVSYFGQTSGVSVVAGQNTTATITFAAFQPTILAIPSYTATGQFVMVFSKVASAASYVVQASAQTSFANAVETAVPASDTSPALSVPATGPFYVRVVALDPYGARGAPSAASTITTITAVTVSPATTTIDPGVTRQFTAVATDAQNNTVTGVTFYWASSNPAVAVVDPQTGLATGVAGGTVKITALGLGLPGNATLTVNAGPANRLVFSVQPGNVRLGRAIGPAVQVSILDPLGNVVTSATNSVTVSIGANPSGGSLSGTRTVAAVAGVATFSDLSIGETGAGYTLAATSGTLTGATSQPFNITARVLVAHGLASNNLSVIETATNQLLTTVTVGNGPWWLAITPDGSRAYVTNNSAGNVSVIRTSDNTVLTTVTVGSGPQGVAITPDGSRAYVLNSAAGTVSVITTATNTVLTTVTVGTTPRGVAITPDGAFVYVANFGSNTVSVIRTSDNTVVATPLVGTGPHGVAIRPDGQFAYVANEGTSNVSVIVVSSNTVVTSVPVGATPTGVAVTPDGVFAYVTNYGSNNVSVISTAGNAVVAWIAVGNNPIYAASTPGGAFVYVTNFGSNFVSVISTATNKVVRTISVNNNARGISVWPGP